MHKRSTVSPLFCIPLLLSVATLPNEGQPIAEKKFTSGVSQDRLLHSVRDLVNFGNRLGGTKSGDRAARYVLRNLKSAGIKAETIDDAKKLTYTNEGWSLRVERPRSLRELIKNEWLAGFSPSVKRRTAPLILIDSENDIEGSKVESSAVLVPDVVSQKTYQKLVLAGCACILSYAPNSAGSYSTWAMITEMKASRENPIPVFNISVRNAERLRKELKATTKVVIAFSSKTSIAMGRPKTVVATLRGEEPDYYIVCAHGDSDSGGPGADDNASGVAGVMELARVLNGLVATKKIPKPRKTIKFIVWGSEYFSTEEYVKRNAKDLGKILGVINYDEIGIGKARNCLYFEGNDIQHNEQFLRELEKVGEDYAGKKGFWEESTTNPSQGGTDSYVFLPDYLNGLSLPRVEIPSVTVYCAAWGVPRMLPQTKGWSSKAWKGQPDSVKIDYSPYYHSSLDVPSTTTEREPFNMVWAVKAVGITLLRIAWKAS